MREGLAANLAQFAEISRRFLEKAQFLKQSELLHDAETLGDMRQQEGYDSELQALQKLFQDIVVAMLARETSPAVKRTVLADITRLCVFFGTAITNNLILPLTITFLNDVEWRLRYSFFQCIAGVATFVGMMSLERFILPCIYQV